MAVKAVKGISKISRQLGRVQGLREARHGFSRRVLVFLAGSGAGAAATYLLDPRQGKRRRHVLRDRTVARLRRGMRQAGRKSRYVGKKAVGAAVEATPHHRESAELNDPTLAAKVESELFRPADAPKGTVDVNVERGVVFLRGKVADRRQLEDLIERAQAVDGVVRAESLLHLPGEPAPHRS